jgi:competence protein ComEC
VRAIPIHLVRDADSASAGPITITALLAGRTFKRAAENNSSIVLRARLGRWTALLTGDVERDAEYELASRDVRADVLKVAHHGSRTSSTAALLDAVQPRLALISCGVHNTFGHPHASVLDALAARGIRTWRTDRGGTIDVDFAAAHIFVRREIDTAR